MNKNRPAKHTVAPAADQPLNDDEVRQLLASLDDRLPLAIAVSGGPDSLALMHFAARELPKTQLHILTVDHGLRAASAQEAKFVCEQAQALGLAHTVLRWHGEKPESGVQEAARVARYELMAQWCRANNYDHLATAHNLDDQAETVLMRLARGSGVDGLAAMAKESQRLGISLLRPLLDVPHKRLVAGLEALGMSYVEDPSNRDERYERVRLRRARAARDTLGLDDTALAQTARRLGRAASALDAYANVHIEECVRWSDYGYAAFERDLFLAAPEETVLRAAAKVLAIVGGGRWPAQDHQLDGLLECLRDDNPKGATLAGCRIVLRKGDVLIARELSRISLEQFDFSKGDQFLWDGRFEVRCNQSDVGRVSISPLGEEGWAGLKDQKPDLPAVIGQTLPAIFLENTSEFRFHPLFFRSNTGEKSDLSAHFINPFR
ncbi:MAG: tRNA lysidine(34) synthetase TilS [Hyphomicrobiales bacterium]